MVFETECELVEFIKKELRSLAWLEHNTQIFCVFYVTGIKTLNNVLNNYGED